MIGLDPKALLPDLRALARRAGAAILDVYNGDFEVRRKLDASPVTAADEAAEAIILDGLRRLTPDIPIAAEEEAAAGRLPDVGDGPFWLVDPLDGTKEFVKRTGEFTVNIGLVVARRPALGVVFAPVPERLFAAAGPGTATVEEGAAAAHPIAARRPPESGIVLLTSRSHGSPEALERWLVGRKVARIAYLGSSLKICMIAAGEGDFYPRFGPTSEWDTAAAHAVLLAAGGDVTTLDGRTLAYGKPGLGNPDFLARGIA